MTLEEFTERIKRTFAVEWRTLNQSEIDDYFESDKTKRHIKQEYEMATESVDEGKMNEDQIKRGWVAAVAECLALMY